MEDSNRVRFEEAVESGHRHSKRVDQNRSTSHRYLDECQVGIVRALTKKLCVDRIRGVFQSKVDKRFERLNVCDPVERGRVSIDGPTRLSFAFNVTHNDVGPPVTVGNPRCNHSLEPPMTLMASNPCCCKNAAARLERPPAAQIT